MTADVCVVPHKHNTHTHTPQNYFRQASKEYIPQTNAEGNHLGNLPTMDPHAPLTEPCIKHSYPVGILFVCL